ncbi:MAG: MerC domain-containing protein [Pseudomonadota bacterium]
MQTRQVDAVAVGVSSLCLIHCLALPLLASALPVMGPFAEAEWIHKVLVLIALPLAVFAFLAERPGARRRVFAILAVCGAAFLTAGAFVEALHDYEVVLTVCGAVLLGAAHFYRWRTHRKA